MHVIRPIRTADLDQLLVLVGKALSGLTTLPPDAEVLAKRIRNSERSFLRQVEKPSDEGYVFVLEDTQTQQVIGICGIEAKTGGYLPFYAYQIQHEKHVCEQLGICKNIPILCVSKEHDGPSEICSLFLSPQNRQKGSGRLLSLSRFVFMADFRERFESQVIAEMRGCVDDDGNSPFWEAIAKHFIDLPLQQADYLSIRDKRFIGDLMPQHPIYIPLLPQAAQDVIGDVHRNTRPALALLQAQGFKKSDQIDIFEAGPIVRSNVDDVFCVRQSKRERLGALQDNVTAELCLVSNGRLDYRCVLTPVAKSAAGLAIAADAAAALEVSVGDEIRWVPAYPVAQGGQSDA